MPDLKLKKDVKIKDKKIAMTGSLLHPTTRKRIAKKDDAANFLESKGGILNRKEKNGKVEYPVETDGNFLTDILIVGTFSRKIKESKNVDKAKKIGAKRYYVQQIFDLKEEE